jgi:LCP family protein required for cell wall assembly
MKQLICVILVAVGATGCVSAQAGPILITLDPEASATPTPFLPGESTSSAPATLAPTRVTTPTFTPTPSDPWGGFEAPVEVSPIDIPPPFPERELSSNTVNLILLGSDQRPGGFGHRTDTLMLISLDRDLDEVTMLSIPRDYYVYIPGWRMDRINTANAHGGFETVAQTILYNFGINVDHWVTVNFYGFIAGVDALGGLQVESTGTLYDECGGVRRSYGIGTYYMDGFEALCYVRMRKTSGDFDRLRRQQEVVRAVFRQVLSLDGLARVPDLYTQFTNYIETDMTLLDVLPLIPLAISVGADSGRVHQFRIDPTMAPLWRVPTTGASVVFPEREAILSLLEQAFPLPQSP